MKMPSLKTIFVLVAISAVAACSPAVGSKEWCDDMKEKDKGPMDGSRGYRIYYILPEITIRQF